MLLPAEHSKVATPPRTGKNSGTHVVRTNPSPAACEPHMADRRSLRPSSARAVSSGPTTRPRAAASVVRSSRLAVAGRLPTSHQYAGTGTGTGALTRGRGDAREALAGPRKSARDGWGEGPIDPASPSPCLFYSPTHTDRCAIRLYLEAASLRCRPPRRAHVGWSTPSPRREHLHLPPAYIHMAAPWPSRAAC